MLESTSIFDLNSSEGKDIFGNPIVKGDKDSFGDVIDYEKFYNLIVENDTIIGCEHLCNMASLKLSLCMN